MSDRKRFPNFYRIDSPDHLLHPTMIALMKKYNWKKVATINQALEYFSSVSVWNAFISLQIYRVSSHIWNIRKNQGRYSDISVRVGLLAVNFSVSFERKSQLLFPYFSKHLYCFNIADEEMSSVKNEYFWNKEHIVEMKTAD